jgi:hypothetical protein
MYVVQSSNPQPQQPTPFHEIDSSLDILLGSANDSRPSHMPESCTADVNQIVARTIAHLTPVAIKKNVQIELDMAPSVPLVAITPTELSFALAGFMGSLLEGIDDPTEARIRIETRVQGQDVRVRLLGSSLPAMKVVRALTSEAENEASADPTVAHCRRLVEDQGGFTDLVQSGQLLGIGLAFPALSGYHPVSLSGRLTLTNRAEVMDIEHSQREAA